MKNGILRYLLLISPPLLEVPIQEPMVAAIMGLSPAARTSSPVRRSEGSGAPLVAQARATIEPQLRNETQPSNPSAGTWIAVL